MDDNKVINFPTPEGDNPTNVTVEQVHVGIDTAEGSDTTVETTIQGGKIVDQQEVPADAEDVTPPEPAIDPDNPVTEMSMKKMGHLVKQVKELLGFTQSVWDMTRREWKLKDEHMKALYQFNEENKFPPPADWNPNVENADELYDRWNGLNSLSHEEAVKIFGGDEEHPVVCMTDELTIERCKSAMSDFLNWMTAMKEYRQIHDGYIELLEFEEDKKIETLKTLMEQEEDPEKKASMKASLDHYYRNKYLAFLADPLDESTIDSIMRTFNDPKKVEYWIERSRTRLKQMKISEMFIPEVGAFEKRFLPEEYHGHSNLLLLYFMNLIIYNDMYKETSDERNRAVCMVFGLDRIVRNVWPEEIKEKILDNIKLFLDQFTDKLPAAN